MSSEILESLNKSCDKCKLTGCINGTLYRQYGPDTMDVDQEGPCECECHPEEMEAGEYLIDDLTISKEEVDGIPFISITGQLLSVLQYPPDDYEDNESSMTGCPS